MKLYFLYQEFPPDENNFPRDRILIAKQEDIEVLKEKARQFAFEKGHKIDDVWTYSADNPDWPHTLKVGNEYDLVIRSD